MENRVEKYKLNAKKAYEFAAGLREIIPDKNRTRATRKSYGSSSVQNELNDEEQNALLGVLEYAYRYSVKLTKKRLATNVEEIFLCTASSPKDIKFAIEYCKFFSIALPSSLHNRVLLSSAMPVDKKGMAWRERYELEKAERKQKRYLKQFQEQKKSFKIILEGLIKENKLNENSTLKELLDSMN